MFLKISQYLQYNTCAGVSGVNFIKKRLQHKCFPVNITEFSKTPISKNICEWLLLLRPSQEHWKGTKETLKENGLKMKKKVKVKWKEMTALKIFEKFSGKNPFKNNVKQLSLQNTLKI